MNKVQEAYAKDPSLLGSNLMVGMIYIKLQCLVLAFLLEKNQYTQIRINRLFRLIISHSIFE